METKYTQLTDFIQKNGGYARSTELIKAGFYKALIYSAMNDGRIVRVKNGVYGLVDAQDISHPDLVTASIMIPNGVICLITALSFYEVTDEIPRYIDVAVPIGMKVNPAEGLPIRIYHFSLETWKQGIEEHNLDGHKIKIFSLAKTIADCFKFRNQIGIDTARSALKNALEERKINHRDVMKYASICRVTNIIKPIVEALI